MIHNFTFVFGGQDEHLAERFEYALRGCTATKNKEDLGRVVGWMRPYVSLNKGAYFSIFIDSSIFKVIQFGWGHRFSAQSTAWGHAGIVHVADFRNKGPDAQNDIEGMIKIFRFQMMLCGYFFKGILEAQYGDAIGDYKPPARRIPLNPIYSSPLPLP